METNKKGLEEFKTHHEASILSTPGVVGIGTGLCKSGKECLKIYTSVPVSQVLGALPQELKGIEFELECVGDVAAQ